jgi:hypothetical protein
MAEDKIYADKKPQNTYWTDWGGWYDEPVTAAKETGSAQDKSVMEGNNG